MMLEGFLQIAMLVMLFGVVVVTLYWRWRRRQLERWQNLEQLNSVYNARERRIRGD
jgi:hypothetical protein